jgi:hypothetical protein
MLIRLVDEHPHGAGIGNLLSPGELLVYPCSWDSRNLFKVIPERVHLEISYAALTDWRTRSSALGHGSEAILKSARFLHHQKGINKVTRFRLGVIVCYNDIPSSPDTALAPALAYPSSCSIHSEKPKAFGEGLTSFLVKSEAFL